LIAELKSDPNKGHFKRNSDWDDIDIDALPDELRKEFIDFLVSSLTAEFSGCVLYKEMKRRGKNKDICELFGLMSRDESRHAGFINDALKEFNIGVNMGFLAKAKKYTYFKPKFIYYATYLSEKIGYARYITIYRHLEKHPERRFHPIFKWFQEWCNDEFRHGEAFSLLMRSDPKLLSGATMSTGSSSSCSRCSPPCMCATMPVPPSTRRSASDIEDYDMKVFHLTSRDHQVRCFRWCSISINPAFIACVRKLKIINDQVNAAQERGGIFGKVAKAFHMGRAGLTFARLYMIPTKSNTIPVKSRLQPVW
jgi:magnesium-protoporphyrin IX monomethyl ester (oxidative) cyclase